MYDGDHVKADYTCTAIMSQANNTCTATMSQADYCMRVHGPARRSSEYFIGARIQLLGTIKKWAVTGTETGFLSDLQVVNSEVIAAR